MREFLRKLGKGMLVTGGILFFLLVFALFYSATRSVSYFGAYFVIMIYLLIIDTVLLFVGIFLYSFTTETKLHPEKMLAFYSYGVPDHVLGGEFLLQMVPDYLQSAFRTLIVSFAYGIPIVFLVLWMRDLEINLTKAFILWLVVVVISIVPELVEYYTDITTVKFTSRSIAYGRKLFKKPVTVMLSGDDTIRLLIDQSENSFLQLELGKKTKTLRLDNRKLAYKFGSLKKWLDQHYEPIGQGTNLSPDSLSPAPGLVRNNRSDDF